VKQYISRKHGESANGVRPIKVYYAFLLWIKMTENLNWKRTSNYSRVKIYFHKKKSLSPMLLSRTRGTSACANNWIEFLRSPSPSPGQCVIRLISHR